MNQSEYHIIGTPIDIDQDPQVFELIISEHIPYIRSEVYGLDEKQINPADFFVTSGDAIQKTKYLKLCFEELASELRGKCLEMISLEESNKTKAEKIFNKNLRDEDWSSLQSYYIDIEKNVAHTQKLISLLEEAKGSNVFMETEWNNHHLLCIPKNPRKAM